MIHGKAQAYFISPFVKCPLSSLRARWLAAQQRVPVRAALDHARDQAVLVAGRSATVEVIGDRKAACP
jgi:multidrug resistance efflux pump